jgi:hypothetical protein
MPLIADKTQTSASLGGVAPINDGVIAPVRSWPVAAIGRSSERICAGRPWRMWPRAMAFITAWAKPTRVVILAMPRMKRCSKPKWRSMR